MSQTSDYVRENIVKVVDSEGNFRGTAFFIEIQQKKYCITCHHCICRLNEIYIEKDNLNFSAEWIEQFSDMNKDIAILKVMDCDNVKHLSYARQIMPRLDVIVWGFSSKDLPRFPKGSPIEDGKLSSSPFLFNWPEENIRGPKEYNKKPEVNVHVFKFPGKIDVGYSGSPVCYSVDNVIVGLLTAKDDINGYVIPIQTLLEKFKDEKQIAKPAKTVNMEDYINKGNESFDKGDYDEAIKNYDEVLNNPNYVIALGNKGAALDVLERHEEAIEWYDKALAIDPNNDHTLNNKRESLARLRKEK